ncbi:uncharacterized protein LOC134535491 [Bacillus rossius redtenbacheri]|uniref:uncharacterized protein LOC134535491 n=1 Tax=Bacillus rossius redtenbacheri TaxID=93214 RepID=UPI002FDDBDA8
MKVLRISDGDEALFGSEFLPDHFKFYLQHGDAFQCMWKEQGPGFWVRFVISLRNFMMLHKKFVINVNENEILKSKIIKGCEDAYCKIIDDFTAKSCSALKTFLANVATVAENKHNLVKISHKYLVHDPFYSKLSRVAFRELFGDPTSKETFITMCDKMMVYLHAAGSVCVLLKRWTVAKEETSHVKNISWKPPDSWNNMTMLCGFEMHLHRKFGEKLFELIGLNKQYDWVAKVGATEAELKKRVVRHMASGSKKLLPWKPLDREWTQKKLAGRDVRLHLTKLVWSAHWLSLSDFSPLWVDTGENVFQENSRDQCSVQISVAMYNHVFGPKFFTLLFKQFNQLKTQLDDGTLKELEHYQWLGKKCGLSKTKWNEIIHSHQVLQKIIPVFRTKTEEMLKFMEISENCSLPVLDEDMYATLAAWNLPLAKDYFDNALCWIACLEELVSPLAVFPVLRELQQPLERALAVLRQGKFCAQVGVVYVDELEHLYGKGDSTWLSLVEHHETIQDVVLRLWLGDWLPELLDSLQELVDAAWSKHELKDGITSSPNRQRIFPKFSNLDAFPSVELLFIDNPRHFAYWIPAVPELDKQNNNFTKVRAVWKEFCSKVERGKHSASWNVKVKEWSSFNKELTSEEKIMFERMNWKPASIQEFVDDVKEALGMIREDGHLAYDIFSKTNEWLKSVVLLNKSNKSSPVLEKMMEDLNFFHQHGCLYMMCKSAVTAIERVSVKRAMFVSQLCQQATRQMAVSSSKVVCLAQVIVAEKEKLVPCPSKNWFDKISSFLLDFVMETSSGNLKQVNAKLDKLSKQFWDKKVLQHSDEDDNVNNDNIIDNDSANKIYHQDDGSKKKINCENDAESTKQINSHKNNHSTDIMNSQENGNTTNTLKFQEMNSSKTKIKGSVYKDDETLTKLKMSLDNDKIKISQSSVNATNKSLIFVDSSDSTGINNKDNDARRDRATQVESIAVSWDDAQYELSCKWQELVKKAVSHCYQLSAAYRQQGRDVSHQQFPHWHTLLWFMREEISYSGACVDFKDDVGDTEELFKKELMGRRLAWMEAEVEKWCADSSLRKGLDQLSAAPADSAGVMQLHASARVRVLFSDVIIRSFVASKLGTLTFAFDTIRHATIDLVNHWSFFMLNLVTNDPEFWRDMSVLMTNFTAFLEIFADYTDTYRDHMVGKEGVNFYETWDLNKPWVPDSADHYRVAILALLRFNLVSFYIFITSELPLLVNLHIDLFTQVLDDIAKFFFCFASNKFLYEVMPGGMAEAKTQLESLWQETKILQPPNKIDMQMLSQLPEVILGDKSWRSLIESYLNGRFDAIATKLSLSGTKSAAPSQGNAATKAASKSKKKQSAARPESRDEVSVSVVQWDEAANNLVMKSITVSRWSGADAPCDGAKAKGLANGAPPQRASSIANNTGGLPQSTAAVKVKPLRCCAYCKTVEPSPRAYMKCALCKQHNFRPPMFYCGQECHAKHWTEGHGAQHAAFTAAN